MTRWLLPLVLLVLGVPLGAWAQDAHYWTRQFGNRAWLLGGAVIGSSLDISAVYYNPGALAHMREPEIQLTGNVFELTRLTVEDGLERGEELATSRLVGSPSLLAGELRLGFLGKSRLGYSVLTRQAFMYRIERRGLFTGPEQPGPPGLERLSTDVRLEQQVGEWWAGLTWAWPLTESVAVGISPYGALRSQRTSFRYLAQGTGADEQVFLSVRNREFRYSNVRLLAKLGLSYQQEPWGLGVTITTPSVSLWGRGASGLDRTTVLRVPDPGAPDVVVSDFQERVPAQYRTPLSVGVGASRQFGRATLHVSAEWFAEVTSFTILDTEPFRGRGVPEALSSDVVLGLQPVVNVGVGLEQRLGRSLRAYVSFHTDFSAARDVPAIDALTAEWDLYHVAAGAHFTLGRASFTLGANVALGDQSAFRLLDFLNGAELAAPPGSARVRFLQATLIFGTSVQLGRQTRNAPE